MYFVGIDVSKYKHDCFITTETGTVITQKRGCPEIGAQETKNPAR